MTEQRDFNLYSIYIYTADSIYTVWSPFYSNETTLHPLPKQPMTVIIRMRKSLKRSSAQIAKDNLLAAKPLAR